MPRIDPKAAQRFAIEVVHELCDAGFEALWAGGCVRDQLLGQQPKDYDVATNAEPAQIRAVFGHHRTLAVGAAFGVITVLGPRNAGQVEVATFRQDAKYSDGRHPDHVTYSSDREDAERRDFTINGLFLDPLANQIIDYVGGRQDLEHRLIRAIGDPHLRFDEDKLRMLRAIRFAATFDFEVDTATLDAVRQHAEEVTVVSAERIAAELRRMMIHPSRRRAVELLQDAKLLSQILPELASLEGSAAWKETLEVLDAIQQPTVSVAWAVLLRPVARSRPTEPSVRAVCRRWKLANHETNGTLVCLEHEAILRNAMDASWPRLQRVLITPRIDESLAFAAAVTRVVDNSMDHIDFCRQRLAQPPEILNPVSLISGDELRHAGIPPGPEYRTLLEKTRDAQLVGDIQSRDEALAFALCLWNELADG